jgi:hypothetical protein
MKYGITKEQLIDTTIKDTYRISMALNIKLKDATISTNRETSPFIKHWRNFIKKYINE